MLRGSKNLNLDAKGRLAIPARYRDQLMAECDGQLIVTVSDSVLVCCLWILPLHEWETIERKLVALPTMDANAQRLKRRLLGHATDVELDKSGRVLLSAELRERAKLDKQVTLVGQGNKFEVWDEQRWVQLNDESDDAEANARSIELDQLSL